MGITRDQLSSLFAMPSLGSSAFAITFLTRPAAGSSVIAALGVNTAGATITSVKDNGTSQSTFTLDVTKTGSSQHISYIYRADGISLPASGNYTVTVTLSSGSGVSVSAGAASYLGKLAGGPAATSTGTATSASVSTGSATPTAAGSLFAGTFQDNSGNTTDNPTATNGNFTQQLSEGNGDTGGQVYSFADGIVAGTSAQACTWTVASSFTYSAALAVYSPANTVHSAAASLNGTGALTAGGTVAVPGAADLAGTGSLTVTPAVTIPSAADLLGEGLLTASAGITAPGQGSAALIGAGSMTVAGVVGWMPAAALAGTGSLAAQYTGIMEQGAALAGTGTLSVTASPALKFTAGLFGAGFLSIPQVAGGLVNGVGGVATPMALPGSSQVAVAPPGSANWQWLGTLGQVTALTYSYVCPGGADKMSCAVLVPASFQSQLFYPGWQVKIVRGGHDIWHGKLDQPSYQAGQGWTLTAVGNGNRGTDFLAVYSGTWPAGQPDASVNGAITRGLPWVNPGIGSPSGIWLGQSVDSGAQTITGLLNLVTSRGGLTWYVNSAPGGLYGGDDLSVFPLPTVPTRLLVCTTPVPRTLGGYTNYLLIRYQASADNTTATPPVAATYAYTTATNPRSIAAHGQIEAFFDLSDAPVMTATQAQNVGGLVLQSYVAASYGGPFTVSYGQLLNIGGQAVDIGCDGAGSMVKLVLADSSYGGSVDASQPVTFIVGSYSYNDMTQTAQVSPYATLDQSLSGLLSLENATLKPITVAGG